MYSLAHVHLLLNHFPIIVTALGLLVLIIAMVRKRDDLTRVAFWLFVGGAVSALPTYLTGDPAEQAVEDMPGVTRQLIHAHEDAAVWAAIIVGILGVFALWALWRYRRPAALPAWVVRTALIVSLFGSTAMARTGLLGGEIRHTEVRAGFVAPVHGGPEGQH